MPSSQGRGAALAALGLVIGLSSFAFGYYEPRLWTPAALVAAGVLAALVLARPRRPTAPALVALGGLAAYAAWTYASAAWSPAPYAGRIDGLRWVLYAEVFAILVLLLRSRRDAFSLLGGVGAGVAVVALSTFARLLGDGGPDLFLGARLNEPLGYVNGQAGVFVLTMFLALGLAERRTQPLLATAGAAGVVLCAGLAMLSQSRGVILAAVAGLAAVLVFVPGRLRRLGVLLVAGAALALALPDLLGVYRERSTMGTLGGTDEAARALAVAAAVAALAWALIVFGTRRAPEALLGRARTAGAVLAGLAVVVAVVALAASAGTVRSEIDTRYDAFTELSRTAAPTGGSRLLSGGGNRYDYWRIAADVWREDRVTGVGAGGWASTYFVERSSGEDVRQPHSLPLQTLAETGAVGLALLLVFLAGVGWGFARQARPVAKRRRRDRTLLVAGLGPLAAWLVHTSVDWMHLLPGVTGIVLAGAAVLVRPRGLVGRRPDPAAEDGPVGARAASAVPGAARSGWGRAGLPVTVLSVVALLLAAVSLSRVVLAERAREQARATLASDPRASLESSTRSLELVDDDIATYYVQAAAAARLGDAASSARVLRAAIAREPRNFLSYSLLGDLELRRGAAGRARAAYRRASALNPRDAVLAKTARESETALLESVACESRATPLRC